MPPQSQNPVVLVPYDLDWARVFDALRRVYLDALGELVVAVEHVGSTAVPGLLAKPIIDIDLVIRSRDDLPRVARQLAALGYRHVGDRGVPSREAFDRDGADDVPRDGSGRQWAAHHLYTCASGSRELRRHLAFRDWLRSNRETVVEYGKLKERLAGLYPHDRDAYSDAKTGFIEAILAKASTLNAGGGPPNKLPHLPAVVSAQSERFGPTRFVVGCPLGRK
jgi:GrpB-like predicted nucleotidyltransferase (UPF0157 family)